MGDDDNDDDGTRHKMVTSMNIAIINRTVESESKKFLRAR